MGNPRVLSTLHIYMEQYKKKPPNLSVKRFFLVAEMERLELSRRFPDLRP